MASHEDKEGWPGEGVIDTEGIVWLTWGWLHPYYGLNPKVRGFMPPKILVLQQPLEARSSYHWKFPFLFAFCHALGCHSVMAPMKTDSFLLQKNTPGYFDPSPLFQPLSQGHSGFLYLSPSIWLYFPTHHSAFIELFHRHNVPPSPPVPAWWDELLQPTLGKLGLESPCAMWKSNKESRSYLRLFLCTTALFLESTKGDINVVCKGNNQF